MNSIFIEYPTDIMEVLSDISSVSSHGSMPPLIDMFGRLVIDDGGETISMVEPVSLPSTPIAGWTHEAEYEEPEEFQFHQDPPRQNTHLFFDEDGNVISHEQYLEERERERMVEEDMDVSPHFAIRTPAINHRFTLRHPRVVLNFLRFLDSYNEVAEPDEVFMIRAIPKEVQDSILNHVSLRETPPEFEIEVNELKYRLARHADLSELPVN